MPADVKEGLEDVVIGSTNLGHVDGTNGELYYCGYNIDDLVEHATYEEVVYLLLNQELPTDRQLTKFTEYLADNRFLPTDVQNMIEWTADTAPMDVLRTAVSMLAAYDDDPDNVEEAQDKLTGIIAKIPTIIAYMHRARNEEDLVKPEPELGHAENFLYMFHGTEPSPEETNALDTALTLYAEHGMNASTFAGVVTTSTLANPYAAVTSAVGALQGDLHGGATETVDAMLQEIAEPDNATSFATEKLDNKEKIPGFGHRVYEVTDPRCKHFKHVAEALGGEAVEKRLAIIEHVRSTVEERLGAKGIWPNTDLYSGTVYSALGIPTDFYTAMFAMARVAGWSAHVLEQLAHNRIIRPLVEYDGDIGKRYMPLEQR